jgi:AraC-like DNA-binding protein
LLFAPEKNSIILKILHELPPLTSADCFLVFDRKKKFFDFPFHYHEVYELNFISGGAGTKRFVGDNQEEIKDLELVLVGKNLPHCWLDAPVLKNPMHEVTIQFHPDLLNDNLLHRNQLIPIRKLLEKASRGILFSQETTHLLKNKICQLSTLHGFESVLTFLYILHNLSLDNSEKLLVSIDYKNSSIVSDNERLETVLSFINNNFEKNITLEEAARKINLGPASFCRFIKKNTGKGFVDHLHEIRISQVLRLLIDTDYSISEISYRCGFNNLSFFNRLFKKKFQCTPKEFREQHYGTRVFI